MLVVLGKSNEHAPRAFPVFVLGRNVRAGFAETRDAEKDEPPLCPDRSNAPCYLNLFLGTLTAEILAVETVP